MMQIDLSNEHAAVVKAASKQLGMSENEAAANLFQTACDFIKMLGNKDTEVYLSSCVDMLYKVNSDKKAKELVDLLNNLLPDNGG